MDIVDDGKNRWTVELEDGSFVHVIKNDFGQIIAMHNGEISQIEPAALDAILHLAKEERL